MIVFNRAAALFVLIISAAIGFAQTGSKPTFEVAVIKPFDVNLLYTSGISLGIQVTAQQVTIRLPLEQLIETAYEVRPGGVDGPDWLVNPKDAGAAGIFDISAKLPEGTAAAQIPSMLRALLEDRFKAKLHRSSKQQTIYALVLGKGGPKFQAKEPTAETNSLSPLDMSVNGRSAQIGGAKITKGPGGSITVEASDPGGLTYFLSAMLEPFPVTDKTGLKGTFDIKLETGRLEAPADAGRVTPADIAQMQKDRVAVAVEKLGLKLEQQKDQVETIVVDHIEQLPTDN